MRADKPRIIVRADASPASGSGHVMRCLALAAGLRNCGATVSFLCPDDGGGLSDLIEHQGFGVDRLPASGADREAEDIPGHPAGRAFSWLDDAKQTGAAIEASGTKPDWLIVDHYTIDQRWERVVRPKTARIMVIDDLADRLHDCDLLLDQNLVARMHERYADKVPATCAVLCGPTYALLQPVYAELHDRTPPRAGSISRLLVFTSGADPANLTGRILAACLSLDRPDIDIDVVIAGGSPHAQALRERAAGHPNVHLHCGLPTLAFLMARADVAIGAAGVTTWERLCLGLPSLVITVAEHQRPIAERLHEEGLIRWLGDQETVAEETVTQVLRELTHQGLDGEWSNRCRAVVDGRGVLRACAAMGMDT